MTSKVENPSTLTSWCCSLIGDNLVMSTEPKGVLKQGTDKGESVTVTDKEAPVTVKVLKYDVNNWKVAGVAGSITLLVIAIFAGVGTAGALPSVVGDVLNPQTCAILVGTTSGVAVLIGGVLYFKKSGITEDKGTFPAGPTKAEQDKKSEQAAIAQQRETLKNAVTARQTAKEQAEGNLRNAQTRFSNLNEKTKGLEDAVTATAAEIEKSADKDIVANADKARTAAAGTQGEKEAKEAQNIIDARTRFATLKEAHKNAQTALEQHKLVFQAAKNVLGVDNGGESTGVHKALYDATKALEEAQAELDEFNREHTSDNTST